VVDDDAGRRSAGLSVLAVGAHPDDIELGCGGALAVHRANGDDVAMLVLTQGERGPQDSLPRVREQEEAAELLGARLFWGDFEDGSVPNGRAAIDLIDRLVTELNVDVLYTHAPDDTHQDHRAAYTASMSAGRRVPRVLLYESPTTTEFTPNVYVDLGNALEQKLDSVRAHRSQVLKNRLVDLEAVEAQARYRAFACRIGHGHAEGFVAHRLLWDVATRAVSALDRVDGVRHVAA
jgi:LmbE family N-acetylglucosaminyl deacetylase